MRHPDDAETDENPDEPVLSRDAVTPRGGFMARPGLKAPPRHAVVVRGGDVEPSKDIPVARGSHPPPAPASELRPVSSGERITLRTIPTPKAEARAQLDLAPPRPVAAPLESVPPPSDSPVVASVPAPDVHEPRARRHLRSRWPIAIAAAAGLLLGLVSIAVTRFQSDGEATSTAAPAVPAKVLTPDARPPSIAAEAPQSPGLQGELEARPSLAPRSSVSGDALSPAAVPSLQPAAAERPGQVGAKRSIF